MKTSQENVARRMTWSEYQPNGSQSGVIAQSAMEPAKMEAVNAVAVAAAGKSRGS